MVVGVFAFECVYGRVSWWCQMYQVSKNVSDFKKNFSKLRHFSLYTPLLLRILSFSFSLFFSILPFHLDTLLQSTPLMKQDMPKPLSLHPFHFRFPISFSFSSLRLIPLPYDQNLKWNLIHLTSSPLHTDSHSQNQKTLPPLLEPTSTYLSIFPISSYL